jgi:hypothetical protein
MIHCAYLKSTKTVSIFGNNSISARDVCDLSNGDAVVFVVY